MTWVFMALSPFEGDLRRGGFEEAWKKVRPPLRSPHHPGPLLPASHAPYREKRERLEELARPRVYTLGTGRL
jgi:hypothetical protein